MEYVLILSSKKDLDRIDTIKKELNLKKIIVLSDKEQDFNQFSKKFNIPIDLEIISESIWEETFRIVQELTVKYSANQLISGSFSEFNQLSSALINASFINGIKILGEQNEEIILLPLFKFTFYKELTDKKKEIIEFLYSSENHEMSLEELGNVTKMSPPLVSYHLNGNQKSEGLKELKLVTSRDNKGKSYVKLTTLGVLTVKDYIA